MRWFLAVVGFVLLLVHVPSGAFAQDSASRAAVARAIFEQGLSFVDSGNWTDAADRFRRALALKESHVIRFNLASALVELGKLLEATELLRQIVADPAADGKVKADAQQKLDLTMPRLSSLKVELEGQPDGIVVQLDQHPLDPAMLGVAIPTDPGHHELKAARGEEVLDAQELTLVEGQVQSILLHTQPVATPSQAAATVVQPEPPAPVAEPDHRDSQTRKSRWLWWGVGGGAAVIATVAVITVLAMGSSESGQKPANSDFEGGPVYVKVSQ